MVIPYRRFGTIYRSYLKRIGPIRYTETSVRNCYYSLRSDPEDRSSLSLYIVSLLEGNLSSCIFLVTFLTVYWGVLFESQPGHLETLLDMLEYYEGNLESKERFAIKKYLLIIGKKKNMQVLSHTFTYFST